MKRDRVRVFADKQMLTEHFAKVLVNRIEKAGKVNISLSGGSTPKAIFDELASNYATHIDWSKVFLFWGDERCVAPTDEQSNYLMTYNHLLSKVNIPETNIFRVKGEWSVEDAVSDYEIILKNNLPLVNDIPQFDIMLLGMGDDGHTASIFPDHIDLWDNDTLCVEAEHPETQQKRVSLTGKVINNSKEIFFLVTGQTKANIVEAIINQKNDYLKYPASRVLNPIWLLDSLAATTQ